MGTLKGTFDQLLEAGCIQTFEDTTRCRDVFDALMIATRQDPCPGCPEFDDGGCKVYQKFNTKGIAKSKGDALEREARKDAEDHKRATHGGAIGGKWIGKTIRQIAEMENISLNEARRRKAAGAYLD